MSTTAAVEHETNPWEAQQARFDEAARRLNLSEGMWKVLADLWVQLLMYVAPTALASWAGDARNAELIEYTHSFYDARELAIERLQAEAEDLDAEGIVGVSIEEKEHSWRGTMSFGAAGSGAFTGEILEFFVVGTAVVKMATDQPVPVPTLVIPANK